MGKKTPFQALGDLIKGTDPTALVTGGPVGIKQTEATVADSAAAVQHVNDIKAAETATAQVNKKKADDETQRQGDRMREGSASRTLLTGPAGLDDEEDSISRRTLQAY